MVNKVSLLIFLLSFTTNFPLLGQSGKKTKSGSVTLPGGNVLEGEILLLQKSDRSKRVKIQIEGKTKRYSPKKATSYSIGDQKWQSIYHAKVIKRKKTFMKVHVEGVMSLFSHPTVESSYVGGESGRLKEDWYILKEGVLTYISPNKKPFRRFVEIRFSVCEELQNILSEVEQPHQLIEVINIYNSNCVNP